MRYSKRLLMVLVVTILSLSFAGCNWFTPQKKSRPAPPRLASPRPMAPSGPTTPNRPMTSPGKAPGLTSISQKDLVRRLDTIERAAHSGNWAEANRETNSLGLDMGRVRPKKAAGKSIREMANFDALYVKLQGNVKVKNKNACVSDVRKLRESLKRQK